MPLINTLKYCCVTLFSFSAQRTGSILHDSATLVNEGGEALARIGANLDHGGVVLDSVSRAVEHGGYLVHQDTSFLTQATRNLVCGLVCPIKQGSDNAKCRLDNNCDISKPNEESQAEQETTVQQKDARSFDTDDAPPVTQVVSERVDEKVAHGLLDMGAQILSAATNILTDIAFIKLKILQGLFSHPDCLKSPKNDNNQCISKLCNYTEQRPKIYMDNLGVCITSQARKWDITKTFHSKLL